MTSHKPIGGYFGLELIDKRDTFPYPQATLLNSGRSAFGYILQAHKPNHVYMPKYTCDVMLEPLEKLGIDYSFYAINENLEIAGTIDLKEGEFIVYTNYFGVKDSYCTQISLQYQNQLILDCSQAFYFDPTQEGHTIYSPRKFFGLPDGGCLVTNKKLDLDLPIDSSYNRFSHLIKRIDFGAEEGYEDFKRNDESLSSEPIKQMSRLTENLLMSVDFDTVKQKRLHNFKFLHEQLRDKNELKTDYENSACPMIYPFLTEHEGLRQRLIHEKIFVATYWPNVINSYDEQELEHQLAKKIIPLPIDQRYDAKDMQRIVDVINS